MRIRASFKDALLDVAQWICAANMGVVVGGGKEGGVRRLTSTMTDARCPIALPGSKPGVHVKKREREYHQLQDLLKCYN